MTAAPVALVLDEHLMALRPGLTARGMIVRTVDDYNAKSKIDPDVIRAVAGKLRRSPWVLVTMDGTIVDEHPKFEWERYAIAWVQIDAHLRGIAVEHAKNDVVQRQAHRMLELKPGDHFTFTVDRQYKHPPALIGRKARTDPMRT